MYNQVHQEQIVAGEMTQNTTEHPAVQEQVIVPEIPPIVERIQEQIIYTIDVLPLGSQIASVRAPRRSVNLISPARAPRRPATTVLVHSLNEELERIETITKRLLEPPLPTPPMVEPDHTSAKRRRRTRYTPLPEILENAVYLAPSAWPPLRHA